MHGTLFQGEISKALAARADNIADNIAARRGLRSAGVLSAEEIASCRSQGIALAFDPVQIGWVRGDCIDDVDQHQPEAKLTEERAFVPRSLAPTYRFRRWTLDDLPVYRALLDDPRVWAQMYEPYPDPLDDDTARALIALSADSGHHEVMAVLRDGEIVGQVRLAFDGASAELSYWFGRAHWGKGLGSAVVAIASGRAFVRHAGLQSLVAMVHLDNAASRRVLAKAGFVAEGPCKRRPGWISHRLTRARAEAINSGSVRV
ncbi:MAG: GNAT family N-acetyltransferase [Tabrizicola sp.]|uniref:GNAT family N-acetyltransferase n=1 Tax=Tabrizicola sp. TaxID=2005166 RepID=UPI002736D6A5|nr:GNAT family N-acetyltransferase [Tabrizicola sp.]MDP3261676.1 GNAT family N-acetyltransferase [Tabrizicola sp.]MDP3648254.1 GNAT family N-acetyltransferase [Paracoccaceae bacterium]MDZ4066669.1 GNAT family N-acetyltransferase [Tabrizicola sp.]